MTNVSEDAMWIDLDAIAKDCAPKMFISEFVYRTGRALRHFLVTAKNNKDIPFDLTRWREHKERFMGLRDTDVFFYEHNVLLAWKNIPSKTLKRHSAFLIYRQQMENQNYDGD